MTDAGTVLCGEAKTECAGGYFNPFRNIQIAERDVDVEELSTVWRFVWEVWWIGIEETWRIARVGMQPDA